MREIQLANGKGVALVDDEDYELVSKYSWALDEGYAKTTIRCANGNRKTVTMHHLIMNPPEGREVDHRHGNGLKNVRTNLRVCTHGENMFNRKPQRGSSRYKGVCWHKQHDKWTVQIQYNKKHIYLGLFTSEEDAAHAYDEAAVKYHGEFARINFPK